jgi:hypothetical protein
VAADAGSLAADVVATVVVDLAAGNVAKRATRRGPAMRRSRWGRNAATRAVATATCASAVATAAMVVASIATAARSAGPVIIRVRTIARPADRPIGASQGIGTRMAMWMAAAVCAAVACRGTARRRVHIVRAVDTATAARAVVRRRPVARAAVAARRAIRTTTSSRGRRWRRRRIRITRCEVRGISCWIIRRRLGRIEREDAGCGGREC